ncbi:MAG TPA: M20/M25/M40 family metallo-hydrolase [Candidatus Poseidoniales archaeon]|nr:M20/M25/M40 family metallo-hydrolase [Candidatus Poseidoniales archaeon]
MNDACAALFGGMMNWAILTVPELKKALHERDLPVSGKKADLIARLKKSDAPVASTHDAPATSSSVAKTTTPPSVSTDSDGPLGGLGEEGGLRRSYAKVVALPVPVLALIAVLLSSTILVAIIQPEFVMNLFGEEEIEYELIEFDADRARGYAQSLVDLGHPQYKGRMSGSAEEGNAASMIMDNFSAMGYQATLEEFDVPMFEIMDDPELAICLPGSVVPLYPSSQPCGFLDAGQQVISFDHRMDYVIQGFSGSADIVFSDKIEVVSIGNGSEDEMWNDVTDKIVLVSLSGVGVSGNTNLYSKAAENNAAALITWNGVYNCGKVEADDCVPIFKGTGVDEVKTANGGSMPFDIPFIMVSNDTGQAIQDNVVDGSGYLRIFTDVDNTNTRTIRVPCGTMYGDTTELVMAGAHHDTVYSGPGAVDDTSGSASILELATQFAQIVEEKGQPKRTVKFCTWGGEEEGLYGSTAWVEKHQGELEVDLRLYINLDMNHADKDLGERGNSLSLFGNNAEDMKQIKAIAKQFQKERPEIADRYSISFSTKTGELGEANALPYNSDHGPFAYGLEERNGDVLVCYGSGSYEYHTYADDMTRFNEESLGVSVVIYGTYLTKLAYTSL